MSNGIALDWLLCFLCHCEIFTWIFLTDLDLFIFFDLLLLLSPLLLLHVYPSGITKGSKSNAPEEDRCCCLLLLEVPD